MFRRAMTKFGAYWLVLLMSLTFMPGVIAGGFQISVEIPDAATVSHFKDAVIVVRTFGCHQPSDAAVSATAEGLVNGRRQSVSLKLTPVDKGVYAISQQWPAQGLWVVAITGKYNGITSSALVELGPNGKVQASARLAGQGKNGLPVRIVQRSLSAVEIETALHALETKNARA